MPLWVTWSFIIAAGVLSACKSTHPQASKEPAPSAASPTPAPTSQAYAGSVAAVRAAPSSVAEEYRAFRLALSDYQASTPYQQPRTDQDRVVKELADAAALVTQQDVEHAIARKSFSTAQGRLDNNPDQLTNTADQFLGITPNNPAFRLTGENEQKKSPLLQGTAIALTVFGGLGVLSAVASKQPFRLVFAAWPLTVGVLMLANDQPTNGTIKAGQAYLGTGAAIFGIAALAMGGLAISGGREWSHANKEIAALSPEVKAKIETWEKSGTYASDMETRPLDQKLEGQARTIVGIAGLIGLGAATYGMSVWTASLGLTSGSELSPAQILAAKMGRAFAAFQGLESIHP